MKILLDNLTRKVSELRKRVEESRRRLCAKKDEMNQLALDVEKKEKEVTGVYILTFISILVFIKNCHF